MVNEADFYKKSLDLLFDYLEVVLGGEFTKKMISKVLSDHINDNKAVWKDKRNLPSRLREAAR